MTLWALLKQNLRHIVRTRLLILLFVFSFFVQYLGMRMVSFITFRVQGIVTTIQGNDLLFLPLYLQLFSGAFLAAAYGIWLVPYLHQGSRGQLTHVLPVPKWQFPIGYALSMLSLLLMQHLMLFIAFGASNGFASLLAPEFPWGPLLACLALETIAFEAFMMGLAVTSLTLGQIPAFFLGALFIFVLQTMAAFLKFVQEPTGSLATAKALYQSLPPVGELVFDLRQTYLKPAWDTTHWWLWLLWLVLFGVLLGLKMRKPGRSPAGEAA